MKKYKLKQFKNEITDPVITVVKNTKIINVDKNTASCEIRMTTPGAEQSHLVEDVDVSTMDFNNLDWDTLVLSGLDKHLSD